MNILVNKSVSIIRKIVAFPIAVIAFLIPSLILKFITEALIESHQNTVIAINVLESAVGCWLYIKTGMLVWGTKYRLHACVAFSLLLATFSGMSLAGIYDKSYSTWYIIDEILSFTAVIIILFWGCMHFAIETLFFMIRDIEVSEIDSEMDFNNC